MEDTKLIKTKIEEQKQEIKLPVPKFSHNSNIQIIIGFYKGYTGIIKEYIIENGKIKYKVDVKELDGNELYFFEDELKYKQKLFGLW